LSDSVRQKFTGYENDAETGLNFAQARYQSPAQGRFTSADPLMASANPRRPQTWNRYSYVLNNPLRHVDPSGMAIGPFRQVEKGGETFYTANEDTGELMLYPGEVSNPSDEQNEDIASEEVNDHIAPTEESDAHEAAAPQEPQNPQPTQQPATAPQCDARIAAIFGGPGAVAATVYEPPGVNVGPGGYRYRYDHLAGQESSTSTPTRTAQTKLPGCSSRQAADWFQVVSTITTATLKIISGTATQAVHTKVSKSL